MKHLASVLLLIVAATPLSADCPNCYFYGGDYSENYPDYYALANENDAAVPQLTAALPVGAATYQNFVVSSNISVNGLFSNNLSRDMPTSAYWELRSDISEGKGGTLIASGIAFGANFSHTPTGRNGYGFTEFHDLALGLFVELSPATYWFAVVPQAVNQVGGSYNSNTIGLNSVGTQIDDEQYWNSPYFGASFTNANNQGPFKTFSSGVISYFVPEPSSLVLLGTGLMGAAVAARRRWFNSSLRRKS